MTICMYTETNRAVKFESRPHTACKTRVCFTRFSCRHVHAPYPFPFEIKRWFTSGVLHQIHFYKIINPVPMQNEIRIKNLSCTRKHERDRETRRSLPRITRPWISLVKEFFFSFHSSRRVTSKSQKIAGSAIFEQPRLNHKCLETCSEI